MLMLTIDSVPGKEIAEVLGVRFTSSAVMASAAEVTIYGTAVKLR